MKLLLLILGILLALVAAMLELLQPNAHIEILLALFGLAAFMASFLPIPDWGPRRAP